MLSTSTTTNTTTATTTTSTITESIEGITWGVLCTLGQNLKVFRQNLFDTPILPSNLSTLTTEVNLNLDHEDYYFTSGIQAFENLGVKHSDRYQFVFFKMNNQ